MASVSALNRPSLAEPVEDLWNDHAQRSTYFTHGWVTEEDDVVVTDATWTTVCEVTGVRLPKDPAGALLAPFALIQVGFIIEVSFTGANEAITDGWRVQANCATSPDHNILIGNFAAGGTIYTTAPIAKQATYPPEVGFLAPGAGLNMGGRTMPQLVAFDADFDDGFERVNEDIAIQLQIRGDADTDVTSGYARMIVATS